ncbi:MAG: PSD1 and planctomycete cytochrome C domain-containing protein [Planctomycetota bacterium]|nr:PSD1 and planctomycete cytochrome C domain-containing protein [Planctomycetota bacterium]
MSLNRVRLTTTLACALAVAVLFAMVPVCVADERPADEAVAHFEQHIRPILVTKCLKCHGDKKQEGKLRLDSREAMLKGGESGPSIVPGEIAESLLIEAINYESFEMPPTGQLSAKEIGQFEQWIAAGAVWPENIGTLREDSGLISPADREWWAFQPLSKPEVPVDANDTWSRNEIDRFVHVRLAEQHMQPAPPADRHTLARRLYFDLLGLPPTPEEIDAFVKDESPAAWEKLVDRLLDDERYGEHWARYWLDLVRFAESDGWNQDAFRPQLWRYRDYVVNSFNNDKPYPEFVRQQLAGDEIQEDNPEHLAAAGYLRLGIYEYNQRDARGHWNDIMNEMTDVTADVFLGLGMACARCHDHKFDPLLQADYFRLQAFFAPISWRDDIVGATQAEQAAYQEKLAAWEEATQAIREQIDALIKPYHDRKWKSTAEKFPLDIQACFYKPVEQRTSWENQMAYLVTRQFEEEAGGPLKDIKKEDKEKLDALNEQLAMFDNLKPATLPLLMTATDFEGAPSPTLIPDSTDETPIEPDFLAVLSDQPAGEPPTFPQLSLSTGRRTALAEWIGRADNPLTTRVIVNRIWQEHFGQGIVSTANDFGHLGQPPTHPELLDWLTVTFIEEGWSIKRLHKRILMSATWQQSAYHPQADEYQQQDAAEQLLWRSRVRRLKAEQIRDAMLAISGELLLKVGGPSVDAKTPRRSLYVKVFRNTPDTFLAAFDVANGLKSVAERNSTTTPTQSLMMINGEYALSHAKQFADELTKGEFASAEEMLQYAFRLAWGRPPTASELANSSKFVAAASGEEQPSFDRNRLIDLCHVLFNSNEFLYVD